MTHTKIDITNKIVENIGFTNKQSSEIVESLLELVKKSLEAGQDVMISNFGKFQVREKAIRKGRNPATGKTLELPARRVVTFRPSAKLRDCINQKI